MFGLHGGEHRKICVNNFSIGPNVINFEENVCKTFHGGISDLKVHLTPKYFFRLNKSLYLF